MGLRVLLIKILQVVPLIRLAEEIIMEVRQIPRVLIPRNTMVLNVLMSLLTVTVVGAAGTKKDLPAHQVLPMGDAGTLFLMPHVV